MYLHHLPSVLILGFFNVFPLSSSVPISNDVQFLVRCRKSYPVPGQPTWQYIAPFPSHCRALANQLALTPGAIFTKPFDERFPKREGIPAPYTHSYDTCKATFFPRAQPGPHPNLARFLDFAAITGQASEKCFEVLPGQQSAGYIVALGTYIGWEGNGFTVIFVGPLLKPKSTGGNTTVVDGGLIEVDSEELWSSLNMSATGVVLRGNRTSASGTVDVT